MIRLYGYIKRAMEFEKGLMNFIVQKKKNSSKIRYLSEEVLLIGNLRCMQGKRTEKKSELLLFS